MGSSRNVSILLFDDVEVLDFAGPFEVFAVTAGDPKPFQVSTVSERSGKIAARNGLLVEPHFTLENAPKANVLVIPGGQGTRKEMRNEALLRWIGTAAAGAELILSVCTGALLLAKAGLLDGLSATTHHGAMELLKKTAPKTTVLPGKKFVDNGKIVTSAGISAGIDASLYAVSKLLGSEIALQTARHMEYDWSPEGARP
ncbi:MAG: DJ-1/PfpI family protein [Bdellovibrionota bacterium]